MFEEYYGLKHTPFDREIPPNQLFQAAPFWRESMSRLRYAARRRKVLLLTGAVGAGKSTALRALKAELEPTEFEVIYLADTDFTPRSFYQSLLEALNVHPPYQIGQAKRRAQRVLKDRLQTQRRTPVLLVDEVERLSFPMLETLRGLLNYDCDAFSPFSLILAGHSQFLEQLRLQQHQALAQRIELRAHLQGLNAQETTAYIRHHLKQAGASQEIFTEPALQRLHRAAGGLPRPVNRLARLCLMAGAASDQRLIDDQLVDQVIATEWELPVTREERG